MHKDALGRLLAYTVWANHRVLRVAARLSVEDFRRDVGASHGGVRGTFTHMLSAEWIWLERLKGVSPSRMLDEGEFPDVVALSERWRRVETHRGDWFENLKETAVDSPVTYSDTKDHSFTAPLWQIVQHVANHSTFHRGQVTVALRQLGAKPPGTDLIVWDREAEARAARHAGGLVSPAVEPPKGRISD